MRLARIFSLEEFEHNFLPQHGVVDSYVLRDSAGQVPGLYIMSYPSIFRTSQLVGGCKL